MDTHSLRSESDIERMLASPAHVAWVKTLAARLIRDETDRDDAVQDSLLALWLKRASIQFPRAFAAVHLRRAGAHTARGRLRRLARERSSTVAEGNVDPARLVEQADLYGSLIRKVAALDEPYRAALVMRYVDDLEPHEIARRTGVPAATIRSRLQRGLEKLRAELDAAHGGDRETWVRAFIVLIPARVGATALVATPLAAGLVLFAAYLLSVEPVSAPVEFEGRAAALESKSDASAAASIEQSADSVGSTAEAHRTELSPETPNAVPPNTAPREHHVVVCDVGGRPIAGARVTLVTSRDARDAELVEARALPNTFADGAGRATIGFDADMIDVADREIVVVALGYEAGRFAIDVTNVEQRLSLFDRNFDRGSFDLVDSRGQTVVGATIAGVGPAGEDVVTDAAGRFEAPVPSRDQPNPKFVVHIPGRVSERVDVGPPAVGLVPRRCTLGPAQGTRVVVTDAVSGHPIARAEITERPRYQGVGPMRVLATTDDAGSATVHVGATNEPFLLLTMIVIHANGYPPVVVQAPPPDDGVVGVRLTRGTSLTGVVVDAATNAPIADARVLLTYAGPRRVASDTETAEVVAAEPRALAPGRGIVMRADGAGRFERGDLPCDGTYNVSLVGDDAFEPSQRAGVLAPAVTRVEIAAIRRAEVERGRVVGTLSFNGTRGPVPFRWTSTGADGSGHANADGSYAIERVETGAFSLTVFVPGIGQRVEKISVAARETATLDIDMTTPLARVRGRAVRDDGSVVPFLTLSFQGPKAAALSSPVQALTDAQGLFEAWLPIDPKSPIEIVPRGAGNAKEPVSAKAGDENILVVVRNG